MKRIVAGLSVLVILTSRAPAQNIDNPPIQGECLTNWCEVVQGPTGFIAFTNLALNTPICLGESIYAWPEADWRCSEVITASRWAPESTNCPTFYSTNESCPYFETNWWTVSGPGGYQDSGSGFVGIIITPTNCGEGTVTFYGTWKNTDPCTGEPIGGGTISISETFTVANVEIAEPHKFTCVCESVSYTLTNTCGEVTWEVWPDEPGGPHASGGSITAGTNCGTWTVIARSTLNTNCIAAAALTVVRVEDLYVSGGTLVGTDPPTYVFCPAPPEDTNAFVTVCASVCGGVEETNLPPCFQMSGGQGTDPLCRQVDLRQLGTTTITAEAGCSSKTVVIRVEDNEPPTIYCPGDFGVCTDAGECFATVDLNGYVSASDNCGPVTVTFSVSSSQFPKGTTSVTATATDIAGNTAQCTFNVIVEDCEPPTIICPENIVVCVEPSGANTVTWPNPTANDNCPGVTVNCDPSSGSQFPVGETTITCTATDSSGNETTCSFSVRILDVHIVTPPRDPEPPAIPIQNNYTFDSAAHPNGKCSVSVSAHCGISEENAQLEWTLDGIQGSTLTSIPYPPKGGSVTFTYTTLPVANSYFGRKNLTANHPAGCGDAFYVDVFFDGNDNAMNHPGLGTDYSPNWFYYWGQTDARWPYATIYYNPQFIDDVCAQMGWPSALGLTWYVAGMWRCYMHSTANDDFAVVIDGPAEANGEPRLGERFDGVDSFADVWRHEARHQTVMNFYWPSGHSMGTPPMAGDADNDILPDSLEGQFGPEHGGPFSPLSPDTDGDGLTDGHDYVYWTQAFWNVGSADAQDWSHFSFSHQYYDY